MIIVYLLFTNQRQFSAAMWFRIFCLLVLFCPHNCEAWLTPSDGYNIGVTLGSALAGVILVALLFFLLYYCWIRQLLFDYRKDHRSTYHHSTAADKYNTGGGYYKKKPPPPDYFTGGRQIKELEVTRSSSPNRLDTFGRGSPRRLDISDEAYYGGQGARPGSANVYHTGAGQGTAYPVPVLTEDPFGRSLTLRAGSPTRPPITDLNTSFDSRRSPIPRLGPGTPSTGLVTTSAAYRTGAGGRVPSPLIFDPASAIARGAASIQPQFLSRPGSGMSTQSRGGENLRVQYRTDGGAPAGGRQGTAEGQRASDSGTGGSLSYEATYQQKVTSTSTKNNAAYLGSSV